MKNYKWEWCWLCDRATVDLGETNSCCAAWGEFTEGFLEWSKNNPPPEQPSEEDILSTFGEKYTSRFTGDDLLILNIFGSCSKESLYLMIKKYTDDPNIEFPSFEEWARLRNETPEYDCETPKGWCSKILECDCEKVQDLYGNDYDTKRVSRRDFVRMCRVKPSYCINKGTKLKFSTGSQAGKTVKFLDNNLCGLFRVELDNGEHRLVSIKNNFEVIQ